jgi:hypothetical protein
MGNGEIATHLPLDTGKVRGNSMGLREKEKPAGGNSAGLICEFSLA